MRIVRRVAERLVDPLLELLGDHVLEAVGLGVDVVDARPSVRARYSSSRRWWRMTSSATFSPAWVSRAPR